jgi:hypothetical protein
MARRDDLGHWTVCRRLIRLSLVFGLNTAMPGLRLTASQACRLWQLETSTCETLLEQLVREGFLYKTDNGAYIAVATSRC